MEIKRDGNEIEVTFTDTTKKMLTTIGAGVKFGLAMLAFRDVTDPSLWRVAFGVCASFFGIVELVTLTNLFMKPFLQKLYGNKTNIDN